MPSAQPSLSPDIALVSDNAHIPQFLILDETNSKTSINKSPHPRHSLDVASEHLEKCVNYDEGHFENFKHRCIDLPRQVKSGNDNINACRLRLGV